MILLPFAETGCLNANGRVWESCMVILCGREPYFVKYTRARRPLRQLCHNIGMRLVTSVGDGDLMYMVGRSRILNSYGEQFVSRDRYSNLVVICIMLPTYTSRRIHLFH